MGKAIKFETDLHMERSCNISTKSASNLRIPWYSCHITQHSHSRWLFDHLAHKLADVLHRQLLNVLDELRDGLPAQTFSSYGMPLTHMQILIQRYLLDSHSQQQATRVQRTSCVPH